MALLALSYATLPPQHRTDQSFSIYDMIVEAELKQTARATCHSFADLLERKSHINCAHRRGKPRGKPKG